MEGITSGDYLVTIYGNFVNRKVSVAVVSVLSFLMLHIPIKYCLRNLRAKRRKAKDNHFKRFTNEEESKQSDKSQTKEEL